MQDNHSKNLASTAQTAMPEARRLGHILETELEKVISECKKRGVDYIGWSTNYFEPAQGALQNTGRSYMVD